MPQCVRCNKEIGRGGIVQEDGTSLCFECDAAAIKALRESLAQERATSRAGWIVAGFFALSAATFGGWLLAAAVHQWNANHGKEAAWALMLSPMATVYVSALVCRLKSRCTGFALGVLVASLVCLPFLALIVLKLGASAGL